MRPPCTEYTFVLASHTELQHSVRQTAADAGHVFAVEVKGPARRTVGRMIVWVLVSES